MSIRHRFYLPLGMPTFAGPPHDTPQVGDSYFDTTAKQIRTWDGNRWVSGGGTVSAGAGLGGGGSVSDDIALFVNPGVGVKIDVDSVALDTSYTDARYINVTGDVMTGTLGLRDADPVNPTDAAHKGYVDAKANVVSGYRVSSGDGLQGGNLISRNPTLSAKPSTGIVVSSAGIAFNPTWGDARYALNSHGHSYAAVNHNHDGAYEALNHTHPFTEANIWATAINMGSIGANGTKEWTITHNIGPALKAVSLTCYGDSGDNGSLFASVQESFNSSASSFKIFVRNVSNSTEAGVGLSVIILY